jgi:hypothetical protein
LLIDFSAFLLYNCNEGGNALKRWQKRVIKVFGCLIVLWLVVGIIDYIRVFHSFEKPVFMWNGETCDCGEGRYYGLGYSFEIKGNFLPDNFDKTPGVTHAEYFLFGINIKNMTRE